MVTNVMVDFLVGLVPIVGDVLDAIVKSNWRNAMILEDYLMLRRRDEIRAERGLPKHEDRLVRDDHDDDDNEDGPIRIHSPELQPIDTSSPHQNQQMQSTGSRTMPATPEQKNEKDGTFWSRF
ncbi:unnamed protein product [Absidia cylindrospora]